MGSLPDPKQGPGFERRVLGLGFISGLPGTVLALILLWSSHAQVHTKVTITLVFFGIWAWLVFRLRDRVVRPIQTLSNMMAALLEGDYSIRSPNPRAEDALGLAFRELNSLGQTLREQRLGALDATSLLRKVMEEVEVAVFVFDPERRLRLVNRAGEKVLARPAERLLGMGAKELGLDIAGVDHQLVPFEDFDDVWDFLARLAGPLAEVINALPDDERAATRAAIMRNVEPHRNADGSYAFPASAWCVLAR